MASHVLLPADLEAVAGILDGHGIFLAQEVERALEVCREAARHPFQDYYGYCLKEAGLVVGFIVFGPIPMTERGWDLYWLAVSVDRRRLGLGRQLLGLMEEVVGRQQGRQIYIETSSLAAFEPARRLYDSAGFTRAACLTEYFRPGVDKLVYVKEGPRPPSDPSGK